MMVAEARFQQSATIATDVNQKPLSNSASKTTLARSPRQAAPSASRLFDEPEANLPQMLRRGEASGERAGRLSFLA